MDKDELRKQAGEKLKEMRKATGLSIFKVGRAIGVTGGYISQVERGLCSVTDAVLSSLADLYQVERSEVFALYRRVENKEIDALLDNPALRKTFTQITTSEKLSPDEVDEMAKELQRVADKYLKKGDK